MNLNESVSTKPVVKLANELSGTVPDDMFQDDSLLSLEDIGPPPRLVRTDPELYQDLVGTLDSSLGLLCDIGTCSLSDNDFSCLTDQLQNEKVHRSYNYNPNVPHCTACYEAQLAECNKAPGGCICRSACAHEECTDFDRIYSEIVLKIQSEVTCVQGLFPTLRYDEEVEEIEIMKTFNIYRRSGSTDVTSYYLVKYDGRIYSVEHDLRLNTFVFY